MGAILSLRRRTISAVLVTLGPLAPGHWSDYARVLCRASWSLWPLGKILAATLPRRTVQFQLRAGRSRWPSAAGN